MMLSDKIIRREKRYPYLLYLLPLLSLLGIFRASRVFLCFDVAVSLLSHLSSLSSLLHLFAHRSVLHTLTHFQPPDFLVILSSFSRSVILIRSFSWSFLMFALLLCYSHNHRVRNKASMCMILKLKHCLMCKKDQQCISFSHWSLSLSCPLNPTCALCTSLIPM